ncbi:ATP-grasp domain-containing protein [Alteromonas oceanisediminis]|uniref:ATP-grasp domain-containing protein n=1 Tax=Alteromonas oceanisediminis TaxID=2836180 RepID=UPI001BD929C3|nr:hypothetical protein [Alteromonas oceanisediminis]MBT0586829.1 hypothetical protein [Alteromonas oceanisediminis]
MKNVAILSMDSLDDFFSYDTLLDAPLRAANWRTAIESWRDPMVNWNAYDVVLVRSPWDYQQDVDAFVQCLARIDSSSATLENPLALMKWNIDKRYLRDLNAQGVPIVPTRWEEKLEKGMLHAAMSAFASDELIVKPVVSANADFTYRLSNADISSEEPQLMAVFAQRALMLQPFLPSILSPGEYSLFYFDHDYSHAILKTPKHNDFRVQEEHGGSLSSVTPTPAMLEVAEKTLAALPARALYARIDLIETAQGLAVMEVELIEPSLYFNMDDHSAQRFADAFVSKFGHG